MTEYGCIEFAFELGERFPDLPNHEIIDAVDEFAGNNPGYTHPDSAYARAYIQAYEGNVRQAQITIFGRARKQAATR